MTDDRFERLAKAWLREGPETAPAWPVEAALVEIETTPQAARPFAGRISPMSMPTRIAAVLVVAVAAVLAAVNLPESPFGGGPLPSPTGTPPATAGPTPSATSSSGPVPTPPTVEVPGALDGSFWSAVHGFSLRYPREWDVRRAERAWNENDSILSVGSRAFDILGTDTIRFSGASQPLPYGWTEGQWLDWYAANYAQFQSACVPFEKPLETIFVGGIEARVNFDGCPLPGLLYDGAPVFDLYFVAEGRGYNLALEGAVNRAYLERILSTFVVRPATGALPVTIPALDTTFTAAWNGFSVRYPADWTVRPATAVWEASNSPLFLGSPKLDELLGATARFSAASQPLLEGWTEQGWYDSFFGYPPECVGFEGEPRTEIVVNGRTWRIYYDGCPLPNALVEGGVVFGAVIVVDGRGYDVALDGAVNREFFQATLSTVTLAAAGTAEG